MCHFVPFKRRVSLHRAVTSLNLQKASAIAVPLAIVGHAQTTHWNHDLIWLGSVAPTSCR
jgi:hypothetical protein